MSVPTVLIVEDEALLREVNAMEFEDAGFRVVSAASGEEALALLAADPGIDLMFTDISLRGGMDGWAMAEHARVLRPDIAVIYATGYLPDTGRLVAGARFFNKPFLVTTVVDAAREMLSHVSP